MKIAAGIYKIYPKLKKKLNRKTKKPKLSYNKFSVNNNIYKEVTNWIFHNQGPGIEKNKDIHLVIAMANRELLYVPEPVFRNSDFILDKSDYAQYVESEDHDPNYRKNYTWKSYATTKILRSKQEKKNLKKKLKKKCIISIDNEHSENNYNLNLFYKLRQDYDKYFFCFRIKDKKKKVKNQKKVKYEEKVQYEEKIQYEEKQENLIFRSEDYKIKYKKNEFYISHKELVKMFNLINIDFQKIKKKFNNKIYKKSLNYKTQNYFKIFDMFKETVLCSFCFLEDVLIDYENQIWLQEKAYKFFYKIEPKERIFFINISKGMYTINSYINIFKNYKNPKISINQKKSSFKRYFVKRQAKFLITMQIFFFENYFTNGNNYYNINKYIFIKKKKKFKIFFSKIKDKIKQKNFYFWKKINVKKEVKTFFNSQKKKKNIYNEIKWIKDFIIICLIIDIFTRTELEIRKIIPIDIFYKEFMTSITLDYSQERKFRLYETKKIKNIRQKNFKKKKTKKKIFKTESDKIYIYKSLIQFQKNIKKLFDFKLSFKLIVSFITFWVKYFCYFVNLNNKIVIIKSKKFKKELKNVNISFMIEYTRFHDSNPFLKKEIFYNNINNNFKVWFEGFYKAYSKLVKNFYFDLHYSKYSFIKFKKINYNMNDAKFVKYRVEKQNFNINSINFIMNYLMLIKNYIENKKNKTIINNSFNRQYISFIENYISYCSHLSCQYKKIMEDNKNIFFKNVRSMKKNTINKNKFVNFYKKFIFLTNIFFKENNIKIKINKIFFNNKKKYDKKQKTKKIYEFFKKDIKLFYEKKNNNISKEVDFFYNANKIVIKEKIFKKKKTKKKVYYSNKIIKTAFCKYKIQNIDKTSNNIFKMFNNLFFFFQKNKPVHNYKNFKKKTVEPTIIEGFFFKKKSNIFNKFYVNQYTTYTRFDKEFWDLFYKVKRSFKRRTKKKFATLENNSSVLNFLNIEKNYNFKYTRFFRRKKSSTTIKYAPIRPQTSNMYFTKKGFDQWSSVFKSIQTINARFILQNTIYQWELFYRYTDQLAIWGNFQKINTFSVSHQKYNKINEQFTYAFCDENKVYRKRKKIDIKELLFIKKNFEKHENLKNINIKVKKEYNFKIKKNCKNKKIKRYPFRFNIIKKNNTKFSEDPAIITRKIKIIKLYITHKIWDYVCKNNKSWPWNKDNYTNFKLELKKTDIIFFMWRKIVKNMFSKKKKKKITRIQNKFLNFIYEKEKKSLIKQGKMDPTNNKIYIKHINEYIEIENQIKYSVKNEINFINFYFEEIVPEKYKKLL